MSKLSYARRIELFAAIEREAKQAQVSLKKLSGDGEAFAPQQEHVDSALRTISSCMKVLRRDEK